MSDNIVQAAAHEQRNNADPKEEKAIKTRSQQNRREDDNFFLRMELEENVVLAMRNGELSTAVDNLEQLSHIQVDPWRKIYTLLQLNSCYIQQEIHTYAVETITKLGKLIVEANPSPKFVTEKAEFYMKQESYAKGFAMLLCACQLYKQSPDSGEAIEGIKECLEKIANNLGPLVAGDEVIKKGVIGYVIPQMKVLGEELRMIASPDSKMKNRASAWCSVRVSAFYKHCGEEMKIIKELKKAATPLTKNEDRCHILGICMHNIGSAYYRLGKLDDAKKYFKKAEHVYHNAVDMTDAKRDEELEKTRKVLSMLD